MAENAGFQLLREQTIPELNLHARLLRHEKTGAELLSISCDDENKCFGVSFRTPPGDSTGVAHILEHGVLAGSRKFPLKDPFAALLKGSLNTFLNAFTYPDRTVYPVASQNLQDFYNLVDVYLDTVFHPLLRPQTFQQQGWHYELERAEDPLIYKGVVFNEMKGNYSSPDSLLYEYTQNALFPATTYGFDSGGDPKAIPDLSYEQFKGFHQRFYHPSNARIFFYGDDDPAERLRILDAYLSGFAALAVDSEVALQPRFEAALRVERVYAASADAPARAMVNVAWMLDELHAPADALALDVLEYALLGTSAAPLRKALIDSGFGEDITRAGSSDTMRQVTLGVGLKGVALDKVDAVEQLILTTLEQLVQQGLDPLTLEAALNMTEFRLREYNTGRFPKGLSMMLRALNSWVYGGDPIKALAFEAPLAMVKQQVAANPRFFEQLIERYLLQNPHRVTLVLRPDPALQQREAAAEQARLAAARASFSPDELQAIIDNTHALRQFQETPDPPEALAALPRLTLDDLPREITRIPLDLREQQGARVLFHDIFTNGIVYLDLALDLHQLPQELLPYVALFGRGLTQLGTEREDFVQLTQRIGRSTGGVYATWFSSATRNGDQAAAWLVLRGKATLAQSGELLAIMRDVLISARLDNRERFRQMVLEEKARVEAGLVPGGSAVVTTRLRSYFTEADWANEQMGGVNYLFFLRQLAAQVDADWPEVQAALERLRSILLNRNLAIANVTLDAASYRAFAPQLEAFLAELPANATRQAVWTPTCGNGHEGLIIPAQVNYVGKGARLHTLGYTPSGATQVIARYLRTTWLWERVRVQGGAYGGGASFDPRSGVFAFTSYRDPNLLPTLEIYDRTGDFLRTTDLSVDELTRSIIGAISDLDTYLLPDAKGWTSLIRYLVGESDELRQRNRDEVLGASVEDFRAFADVLDRVRDAGRVVVMGGQEALQSAADSKPGWLALTRVL